MGLGVFLIALGVILFMSLENWSFVDAFYYTVATMTTVGFGDLTPTHAGSRFVATLYMLLSVPFTLIAIGLVVEAVHDRSLKRWSSKKRR